MKAYSGHRTDHIPQIPIFHPQKKKLSKWFKSTPMCFVHSRHRLELISHIPDIFSRPIRHLRWKKKVILTIGSPPSTFFDWLKAFPIGSVQLVQESHQTSHIPKLNDPTVAHSPHASSNLTCFHISQQIQNTPSGPAHLGYLQKKKKFKPSIAIFFDVWLKKKNHFPNHVCVPTKLHLTNFPSPHAF